VDILSNVPAMRDVALRLRAGGRRLAFVPTMGALHEGHLSLMRLAREHADAVVASIFVNPTQFGPSDDFAAYPRNLERDCALLRSASVEAVFAPEPRAVYPAGFRSHVEVAGLSDVLIGAHRPGHFRGVATVVLKLLHVVQPDVAVFGWKDAQQLVILKRMVEDLDVPVAIVGAPIVREPDGLAMSSRNVRLDARARAAAPAISRGLRDAANLAASGERSAVRLVGAVRRAIEDAPPLSIDRIDLVSAEDLSPVESAEREALLLVSARVHVEGQPDVLLIDNLHLPARMPAASAA